ncbi:MAG: HesA/MoeB/ThiF family protein [Gammaproteobacteria bacterium]|nr:HesA/MoeB/ThiF family protein [Gammaproteobacteria bacterium]
MNRLRYARHLALPQVAEAGQQRLAQSNALVIGLGGLGATAALYLGNSGIGHLVINDFDRVDESNLPRQILFQPGDVDQFKTHAAAEKLRDWNPELKVSVLNRRLAEDELADAVSACDVVLDCTDNFATRMRINAACAEARTPMISGAAIRLEGQLAIFRHADGKGPCYRCLYTEDDESTENCAGQGILGPVAGTIGCMMATEAIKVLAGLPSDLDGRLWIYDGLAGSSRIVGISQREDCPICGTIPG